MNATYVNAYNSLKPVATEPIPVVEEQPAAEAE